MLTSLTALAVLAALALVALGVGARVMRALGLGDAPLPDRAPFALAIGLGCLAYGVLALGLLRLLFLPPVAAFLAILLALGARSAWMTVREAVGVLRRWRPREAGGALALGAIVFSVLALTLVAAVAPPSGSDWDGLSYHLADPAIYLRHRAIVPLFWESHSNFPFTVEMLYTLGLLLGSQGGARAFHWLFLVIACVALAAAWRRLWPDAPARARWLAPLILCTSPVVVWTATLAYNDLALLTFELLAGLGVLLWARTRHTGWLWAGALCLGFALGTKMTALVQALLLAPLVVAAGVQSKSGWRRAIRHALAWGAIAMGIGAPWYVKSYLWTGNPVYPFFYSLFPGTRYWNAQIAESYARHQAEFGVGHTWKHLLSAPWDLVAHAHRFTDGAGAFPVLFGSLGPAFLALAPAVLLLRRRDRLAAGMLVYAAAYGAVWFHLSQQTRYLMPVLPWLALAGARGLTGLVQERRIARLPGFAAVGVPVAHALAIALLMAQPAWPVVTGRIPAAEYLRSTFDLYPMCEYINAYLPQDARILLIHEVRGFYLERDYLWGNQGHHDAIPWTRFRNEAAMRRFLHEELGVTHVLVNHRILPRDAGVPKGAWERPLWDAIRAGTLVPEHEDRGFCLYSVQ